MGPGIKLTTIMQDGDLIAESLGVMVGRTPEEECCTPLSVNFVDSKKVKVINLYSALSQTHL